jgi:ATP-dependent RNA helicase RhlE
MTQAQSAVQAPIVVGFADLALSEPIQRAIADTGYTTPTPIQAQAIPLVLAGGDLLAAAQTGTGKTAGFTLPILHILSEAHAHNIKAGKPRCLILTPTRELAAQVEESVQTYGKHLPLTSMVMFGGVAINPQIAKLKKRVDILVSTPGRLLDHCNQKTVDLSGVEILVLDEADRMLDMGFIRDIKKVLAMLPKQRQNLLFSATFSDEIKTLADGLLHKPGFVSVAARNTASELVTQSVHLCPQKIKRELLAFLIKKHQWFQVLVFTRTKHGANKLSEYLVKHDIPSAAIHGNKSQAARTRALSDFKDAKLQVLVATDIAARGLDIDQLPQVVNFELPNVSEDYVHRIGRTGRAGSSGAAVSLVDREELPLLKDIERLMKRLIEKVEVPDFVPSAAPQESDERPPREPRGVHNGGRDRQGQGDRQGQKPAKPRSAAAKPQGPRQEQGPRAEQAPRQARPPAQGHQSPAQAQPRAPRAPRQDGPVDDDFGNRVDYQSRAKPAYRDPEAPRQGGHRHGNGSSFDKPNRGPAAGAPQGPRQGQGQGQGQGGPRGGNPNRGTPAALDESKRSAVTLTGRKPGDVKPAALFSPRGGGNGGNR